jgi:hypothetical protein
VNKIDIKDFNSASIEIANRAATLECFAGTPMAVLATELMAADIPDASDESVLNAICILLDHFAQSPLYKFAADILTINEVGKEILFPEFTK